MEKIEMKVKILMSTYNGQQYLNEQIDSIINQTYSKFELCIRDDGSTDNTFSILSLYEKKDARISVIKGCNVGVSGSFFSLMREVCNESDIYVFSDQDDVWLPNKLQRIVDVFAQQGVINNRKAFLYCGEVIVTDSKLCITKRKIFNTKIVPSFANALIENICIGCTAAMNVELLNLIIAHIPQYTIMHDWWFYLTASCFGEVFFDNEPQIFYRQHQNNVIGGQVTQYKKFICRVRNAKRHRGQIFGQVREFAERYGEIGVDKRKALDRILKYKHDYWQTCKLVFDCEICRQNWYDDIVFRLLYVFRQI